MLISSITIINLVSILSSFKILLAELSTTIDYESINYCIKDSSQKIYPLIIINLFILIMSLYAIFSKKNKI